MSGCLPSNRLCGRWGVEPFVEEINRRYRLDFAYQECLDAVHRNSPQPEARYRDAHSGRSLVVEHKRLIWPADHARRHKRDHRVADHVLMTVGALLTDAPYALRLPFRVSGTDLEVDDFARGVADSVVRYLELIHAGIAVGDIKGPRPWNIRRERLDERGDEEPPVGLVVRWDDFTDELDPALRRRRTEDCSQASSLTKREG